MAVFPHVWRCYGIGCAGTIASISSQRGSKCCEGRASKSAARSPFPTVFISELMIQCLQRPKEDSKLMGAEQSRVEKPSLDVRKRMAPDQRDTIIQCNAIPFHGRVEHQLVAKPQMSAF